MKPLRLLEQEILQTISRCILRLIQCLRKIAFRPNYKKSAEIAKVLILL